jgi:hypothetical protein
VRAYVTARNFVDTSNSAIILELASGAGPDAVIERLAERAPREARVEGGAVFAELDGEAYGVRRAGRMLAAVPVAEAAELPALDGATELPRPAAGETLSVYAEEPSSTLGPTLPWPESIESVEADIEVSRAGAAIHFVATSTSPRQARADADVLAAALNDLATVDLVLFKMRLNDPVSVTTRDREIEMTVEVGRAALELVLAWKSF